MASFLNGLMGALKGFGGDVEEGIGKAGRGLMSFIDPAANGTPGGAARAPGAGGLMAAAADPGGVGDFHFGNGLEVLSGPRIEGPAAGPTAVAVAPAKKPGFFQRIRTVDPETGMSSLDKFERLGSAMRDDGGEERIAAIEQRAAGRRGQSQQAALAAQIDELFPDDAQMRFLLKANPDKATAALADIYKSKRETRTVAPGSYVGDGEGASWMAPQYGQADGQSYRIGPDGFDWGDQRDPTYSEMETRRHNRAEEGLGGGRLGVDRQRLELERERAARGPAGGGGPALPPLPPGFRRVQ